MKEYRVSGIYFILNKVNGNFYIGSAVNIDNRFSVHKTDLRRNNHHSRYLQNAWNKYGEQNFQFEILEKCDRQYLIEREQFWFDNAKPVYNVFQYAHSALGHVFSEEAKQKIREAQLRLCENPEEIAFRSNKAKIQWATPGIMDGVIEKAHAGLARYRKERISAGLPLDNLTPEQHKLIGEKNTGRKNTAESCKQMSESHKGVPWTTAQHEARKKSNTPGRLKAQSLALKKYYDSLTPEEKRLRALKQIAKRYGKPIEYYLEKAS